MLKIKGFTLIELMVVVVIIGILATIAIPAYQRFIINAKTAEAAQELGAIRTGQTSYFEESSVNATGGYQSQRFYNVNDLQPAAIPSGTKSTGVFTGAGWQAIRFSVADALFFSYNTTASGTGTSSSVAISASADLNGNTSNYTVRTMVGNATGGGANWSSMIKIADE